MKKFLFGIITLFTHSNMLVAQNWDSIAQFNRWATTLYGDTTNNVLYVAGQFTRVNGQIVCGIAQYKDDTTTNLGLGLDYDTIINLYPGNTNCIIRYGNNIVVGGSFKTGGTQQSANMTLWDGIQWQSLNGGQPNDAVTCMTYFNSNLVVCGVFDSVGNIPAKGIGIWDGSGWNQWPGNYDFVYGGNAIISAVEVYDGNLYLGGTFFDPNGAICHLAKYDSSGWIFYTNQLQCGIGGISDMEVFNNELYVCGTFSEGVGNNPGTSIIKWNNVVWSDVGGSVSIVNNQYPAIKDMTIYENKLYCVGNFEKVANTPANGLASWDGNSWCGYNTSFTFNANDYGAECLATLGDTLFIGGHFDFVNTTRTSKVAKWIGGNYVDTCGNTTSISELLIDQELVVYPNPAHDVITISGLPSANPVQIEVFNIHGQMIFTSATSTATYSLNTNSWSPGLYSIRLISPTTIVHRKVVVAR